eukprot:753656-Hanusia_phi.AAC.7
MKSENLDEVDADEESESEPWTEKRRETKERAEKAMQLLANPPDGDIECSSESWNRLGLNSSSHEIKRMFNVTKRVGSDMDSAWDLKVVPEKESDGPISSLKHRSFLAQNENTFIAFKWVLQALLKKQVKINGGCEVRIADVLLFESGEPKKWIYTKNSTGRIASKTFDSSREDSWTRFLRRCTRLSGNQGEMNRPICIEYKSTVEGVSGRYLTAQDFYELKRTDSVNKYHLVAIQAVVGARSGKVGKSSSQIVVYKTEFKKRPNNLPYTMKHTKEYDMTASVWDTHMSNSFPNAEILKRTARTQQTMDMHIPMKDGSQKLQNIQEIKSQSLNRSKLSETTVKIIKYVEKGMRVSVERFRAHFIEDFQGRVWFTGASNVSLHDPMGELFPDEENESDDLQTKVTNRIDDIIKREQTHGRACLEAIQKDPSHRTPDEKQISKTAQYKFVESGVELFYSDDFVDEMYIIITGTVRAMLEPSNTFYCRTVDLTDKDTIAENAITKPGSMIKIQALALEDTNLIVLKRQSIENVLNKSATHKELRWTLKRTQLERCRKIFSTAPVKRSILDLKAAACACVNLDFFQNVPFHLQIELCRNAVYKSYEVQEGNILKKKETSTSDDSFYVIISGKVKWVYHNGNSEITTILSQGEYFFTVGDATSIGNQKLELIMISQGDWENCVHGSPSSENSPRPQLSMERMGGNKTTFLTQVEFEDEAASQYQSVGTGQEKFKSKTDVIEREKFDISANIARQKERHITCSITGVKFPVSQKCVLRRRQIQEAALHLKNRNVQVPGFDNEKTLQKSSSIKNRLFPDNLIVSPQVYDIYLFERNLIDQEKIFVRSISDPSIPAMSERQLPPGGINIVTTRLYLSGIFIELLQIDSCSSLSFFGKKFEIKFKLLDEDVITSLDVSAESENLHENTKRLDEVRMSWFFAADEGVNEYLTKRSKLVFEFCSEGECVAFANCSLKELASRAVLHQNFQIHVEPLYKNLASTLALQFVVLHVNVGCVKFREVDVKDFHLRRRNGLFFPSSPFITQKLPPEGWDPCNEEYFYNLIHRKAHFEDEAFLCPNGVLMSQTGPHASRMLLTTASRISRKNPSRQIKSAEPVRRHPLPANRPWSAPLRIPRNNSKKASGSFKSQEGSTSRKTGDLDRSKESGGQARKLKRPVSSMELRRRSEDTWNEPQNARRGRPKSSMGFSRTEQHTQTAQNARMSMIRELQVEMNAMDSDVSTNFGSTANRPHSAFSTLPPRKPQERIDPSSALTLLTRPKSALEAVGSKSVRDLDKVARLSALSKTSKLSQIATRKSKASADLFSAIEAAHDMWRNTLTKLDYLDEDLEHLDVRTKIVAVDQ